MPQTMEISTSERQVFKDKKETLFDSRERRMNLFLSSFMLEKKKPTLTHYEEHQHDHATPH